MGNKKKEVRNRCEKCNAFINEGYALCSVCNKKYNNEIIIVDLFQHDIEKTTNFYKLMIVDKFVSPRFNIVILTFIEKYNYIANKVIDEIRHMGIRQGKRYSEVEKKPPRFLESEYIKAPLELIPGVRSWKKDIEDGVLRRDD